MNAGQCIVVGGGIKCQGCKGIATRVDDAVSLHLVGEQERVITPAFGCPRCQTIIFVNELDEGKFVPPEFRLQCVPAFAPTKESSPQKHNM
jgi:hypothetical protein